MKALPAPEKKDKEGMVDFDKGFSMDELEIYVKYGLPLPSKVYEETKEDPMFVKIIYTEIGELNKTLGSKKRPYTQKVDGQIRTH